MPAAYAIKGCGVLVLACALSISTCAAADSERVRLPTRLEITNVASSGQLIQVPAGGDFQAALNSAAPGDTIELEAGAVFRGPFTAPRKPIAPDGVLPAAPAAWITIRPGPALVELPPQGVRVAPRDAPAMARLDAAAGPALLAAPGANHYRFVGIEFGAAKRQTDNPDDKPLPSLVRLDARGGSAKDTPHHFIFERCYLHGDPNIGTRRGIIMNSASTAVMDSYFSDFKMISEDSQAIIGWSGPGPYLIRNNYLEAAGENVMFGGGDPSIPDLVPADIEIRGNQFSRPTAWQAEQPDYKGTHWSIKNLFELKNARRVLVDGNLFEYNWPQSQNGFAILFTVRNQDGKAPWSVVEDITFSNNIVRHVASAINILGQDDNHPSQRTRRIMIRNNLFEDIGGQWGDGDLLQMLDGAEAVTIEHNTALQSGRILNLEGRPHVGFTFRNNIVRENEYGIVGTDTGPGQATLERYFIDPQLRGNLFIGATSEKYPAGNDFSPSLEAAGLTDPAQAKFRVQTSNGNYAGVDIVELCAALSVTERPDFCAPAGQAVP